MHQHWMNKEVVAHIQNGILLSYKKKHIESVLMRWMKLEPVIQSEISQKEKDKYCILMHIYIEFRMTVPIILHAGQHMRHRCKVQTFGLRGRMQGWDDLRKHCWNMSITIYKTDDQCKFNSWSRATKVIVIGTTQRDRWGGRWEGCSGWGDRFIHMASSSWCMRKTFTIL